jgi:hypothetical protein
VPAQPGAPCDDGNPCTVGESCTGLSCGGGIGITRPPEAQNVSAGSDKKTYNWSSAAFATRYDVVRGALAALPVGPGGLDEFCFDNLFVTSVSDSNPPSPGTGFWYLSRGENSCGIGTYGFQGVGGVPGAERLTSTCPP